MDEYFTVAEVAEKLKFDEQKIRKEIRSKRLRAQKFGKEYRISAGDIRDYLKLTETKPKSEGDLATVA